MLYLGSFVVVQVPEGVSELLGRHGSGTYLPTYLPKDAGRNSSRQPQHIPSKSISSGDYVLR